MVTATGRAGGVERLADGSTVSRGGRRPRNAPAQAWCVTPSGRA